MSPLLASLSLVAVTEDAGRFGCYCYCCCLWASINGVESLCRGNKCSTRFAPLRHIQVISNAGGFNATRTDWHPITAPINEINQRTKVFPTIRLKSLESDENERFVSRGGGGGGGDYAGCLLSANIGRLCTWMHVCFPSAIRLQRAGFPKDMCILFINPTIHSSLHQFVCPSNH